MTYRGGEAVHTPARKSRHFKDDDVVVLAPSHSGAGGQKAAKPSMEKEVNYDLYGETPQARQPAAIGYKDQEFPNHWTRYRSTRRTPKLR